MQAVVKYFVRCVAGPLDKKTIAERAVCENLCKIRPLAGDSANVKRVSNEGSVTCKNCYFGCFGLGFSANVKKVPNGRLQGLDPGEMVFRGFPFRLCKSRK